jgi:serine/threonine-protein kinase
MACVYRAYDNVDDRIVAVKILKDEYLTSDDFRQRFKNESKVIAILSHPNIVKVYDVSYGDRLQYIVMEYVEGITLKEYIRQQGRLQPREVIHFTAQILRALQHAHDKGIVHRDIKPQNILLLANGFIKVTDFGIARFSTGLTKSVTESAIGSVHYISPEQARGETTDDKADIYSVGVVLYEMLTGALPFQSENSVSVAMMQIQNDPAPPTQINSEIPLGLEQMTLHAMRKNPKERYQSAAEMILDLEELRRNPSVTFDYGYSVDTAPTKYITGKPAPKTAEPAEDAEAEKAANRTTPIIAGVVGAVVLVALVFLGLYAAFIGWRVEVPTFTGLIYENDIKPELQGKYKNFVITIEEGTSPSLSYVTPGQVYNQSITPKTRIKKGSAILLSVIPLEDPTVKKVKIPADIIGMSFSRATETLKDLNLKVTAVPDTTAPASSIGYVTRCDPKVGEEVAVGSEVQIWYGFEGDTKEMPNLVNEHGLTLAEAKNALEGYGFVLDGDVLYADSADMMTPDRVIAQDLVAGKKYPVNSKVKVTLSTGKAPKSDLKINLILPNRNNIDGEFKVYIGSELHDTRKLRLDGAAYEYTLTSSGTNKKITASINGWQIYSATVDFTAVPPKVTGEKYAAPDDYAIYLPGVVGLSAAEGISTIIAAGFGSPEVKYRDGAEGVILDQTPSSGSNNVNTSYYPRSTKITITVGRAVPTTPPATTPPPSSSADVNATPADGL